MRTKYTRTGRSSNDKLLHVTLNRAVPFSGRSLSTFYCVPNLVTFFPASIKLPVNPEFEL